MHKFNGTSYSCESVLRYCELLVIVWAILQEPLAVICMQFKMLCMLLATLITIYISLMPSFFLDDSDLLYYLCVGIVVKTFSTAGCNSWKLAILSFKVTNSLTKWLIKGIGIMHAQTVDTGRAFWWPGVRLTKTKSATFMISSMASCTYPITILDAGVSSFGNKVPHYFLIALFSCHMQRSPLKRKKILKSQCNSDFMANSKCP